MILLLESIKISIIILVINKAIEILKTSRLLLLEEPVVFHFMHSGTPQNFSSLSTFYNTPSLCVSNKVFSIEIILQTGSGRIVKLDVHVNVKIHIHT